MHACMHPPAPAPLCTLCTPCVACRSRKTVQRRWRGQWRRGASTTTAAGAGEWGSTQLFCLLLLLCVWLGCKGGGVYRVLQQLAASVGAGCRLACCCSARRSAAARPQMTQLLHAGCCRCCCCRRCHRHRRCCTLGAAAGAATAAPATAAAGAAAAAAAAAACWEKLNARRASVLTVLSALRLPSLPPSRQELQGHSLPDRPHHPLQH